MTTFSAPALVTTDGRVWAWDDLDAEFRPAIEGFARSRGIRDAGDVAGDVFAAALPRIASFTGTSRDLRSFLFTIAHRRVADEHRRFYRRPERLTAEPVVVPADDEPDEDVVERDEARSAFAALGVLDERSRQVLLLRIVDERTTEDVAAELGLSTANVRKVQSRALRQVRKFLEKSRHTPAGRAMALVVTPLFKLRGADALPTDGPVGEWIVSLQAEAAAAGAHSAAEAMALATAAATAAGVTTAVSATTTATVATAVATGGTIMKTNLTISVLAATAAAIGGGVAANAFDADSSVETVSESIVEFDDDRAVIGGALGGSTSTDVDDEAEATAGAAAAGVISAEDDEIDADAAAAGGTTVDLGDDDVALEAEGSADGALSIDDDASADAETGLDVSIDGDDEFDVNTSADTSLDATIDLDDEVEVDADADAAVDVALDDDVRVDADVDTDASVRIDDDVQVGADTGVDAGISLDDETQVDADVDTAVDIALDDDVQVGAEVDVETGVSLGDEGGLLDGLFDDEDDEDDGLIGGLFDDDETVDEDDEGLLGGLLG